MKSRKCMLILMAGLLAITGLGLDAFTGGVRNNLAP